MSKGIWVLKNKEYPYFLRNNRKLLLLCVKKPEKTTADIMNDDEKKGPQPGTSTGHQGVAMANTNATRPHLAKGRSMPDLMAIVPRPKQRAVFEAPEANKVPSISIKFNRAYNTGTVISNGFGRPVPEIPEAHNTPSVAIAVEQKTSPKKFRRSRGKNSRNIAKYRRPKRNDTSIITKQATIIQIHHEQQTEDSYLNNNEDYEMIEMWKATGISKNKLKDIIEGLKITKTTADKGTSTDVEDGKDLSKNSNSLDTDTEIKQTIDIEKELEIIFGDDNDYPLNLKTYIKKETDTAEESSCGTQTDPENVPTSWDKQTISMPVSVSEPNPIPEPPLPAPFPAPDPNPIPEPNPVPQPNPAPEPDHITEKAKDAERLKRAMAYSDLNKQMLMQTYSKIKQAKPNEEEPKNLSKRANTMPKTADKPMNVYSPYDLQYFLTKMNNNNKVISENNKTSASPTQAAPKKVNVAKSTKSNANSNELAVQPQKPSAKKTNSTTNNTIGQASSVPNINIPQISPGNVNRVKPTVNAEGSRRKPVNCINTNQTTNNADMPTNYMNMTANINMPSGSGMASERAHAGMPQTSNINYYEYHQQYQMSMSANSNYSLNPQNAQMSQASYQERYEELTNHANNGVNVAQNVQMQPGLPVPAANNMVPSQMMDRRNYRIPVPAATRQDPRCTDMNRLLHQMNYGRAAQNEAAFRQLHAQYQPTNTNVSQMGSLANVVPEWPWDTHVMPSARRWNNTQ